MTEAPNDGVPTSVCSWPCEVGQIYIQGEVKCCWQCHTCRENEVVNANETHCTLCRKLTWPDPEGRKTCLPIWPTFLQWVDPFGMGLTTLASLGVIFAMSIIILFTIYSERRIVKASCIELTGIYVFNYLFLSVNQPII